MNLDNLKPSFGYVPKHRLFDVSTLAFHFGVAKGTIYRWVSEDNLPHWLAPRGATERRRYDLLDVQRAFNKRHGVQSQQELTEGEARGEDSN